MPRARKETKNKVVNLALQGGGAHGAYTWGVLDKLLEDGRVDFEAISGTSAGAVNAVVMAAGMARDGREGARADLHTFWEAISKASRYSIFQRGPIGRLLGSFNLEASPSFVGFDLMSRLLSPYDFNPFGLNPMRDVLDKHVDWDMLCASKGIQLFISATDVRSGKVKVFPNKELSTDAVLASACLPMLFQAVEIDDHAYWDGGYMGNPSLWPFSYECGSNDILIVQINPLYRKKVPRTSREILDRINEITFNSSLLRELRNIEFVGRLLDDESVTPGRYRKMLVHMIGSEPLDEFGAASKFNAEWDFLCLLRDHGRNTAGAWLDAHLGDIGERSSVDLRAMFDGSPESFDAP